MMKKVVCSQLLQAAAALLFPCALHAATRPCHCSAHHGNHRERKNPPGFCCQNNTSTNGPPNPNEK